MKRFRRVPTLLGWMATWALAVMPLRAQVPGTGTVHVTVTGTTGNGVPGALVTLVAERTGWTAQTPTDGGGELRVEHVPVGTYSLVLERLGYRPARVARVEVRAGREVAVAVTLAPVSDAPQELAAESGPGPLVQARPGASRWLAPVLVEQLPVPGRSAGDLAGAVTASRDLSLEGLPTDLSAFSLDGMRWYPFARARTEQVMGGDALTRGNDAALDVVLNGADVRLGGAAAAWLGAYGETGAPSTSLKATAFWAADPVSASSVNGLAYEELHGALELSGGFSGGRGRFTAGAAMRRADEPFERAWADTTDAQALIDAAAGAGVDLADRAAALSVRAEAVNAWARGALQVSDAHEVELVARAASLPQDASFDIATGATPVREGKDFAALLGLRSRVTQMLTNQLRLSVTRTERTRDTTSAPFTFFAGNGAYAGNADRYDTWSEAVATLSSVVTGRGRRHEVTAGAEVSRTQQEVAFGGGLVRRFAFGGAEQVAAGTGAAVETQYPATTESWAWLSYAAYVQDRVELTRGLHLQLGARLDGQMLPDNHSRDEEWFRLTGIANDAVTTVKPIISPRIAATWDVDGSGDWLLHAVASMHAGRIDPHALADWQTDDGNVVVTRTTGSIGWPGSSTGGFSATRLSFLGRDFALPRTGRLTVGAARRIDTHTTLAVSGALRRTEKLPRRNDLNLLPLPVSFDQYGRGVYGTLVKQGALVTATPGSNRRFDTYDEVAAITSDGWSDYWGATLEVTRDVSSGTALFASYTYSRTTDNWVGAASYDGSRIMPALDGVDAWDEGRSDFDRPHRLAAGAAITAGPVGIAALYRLESGVPFTPGFRVDVNADGAAGNDPAFVDPDVEGMTSLLSAWDCLRASEGTWAQRNSCRTDASHALDVRGSLTLRAGDRMRASLLVEAFDLLDSWQGAPDAALYLLDPAADLVVDDVARTVTLPLIPNPRFGSESVTRRPGRKLRVGISLNW